MYYHKCNLTITADVKINISAAFRFSDSKIIIQSIRNYIRTNSVLRNEGLQYILFLNYPVLICR
jgi:hypothetical protein